MRRLAVILLMVCAAPIPALAGSWDPFGSVAFSAGRVADATFHGEACRDNTSPNFDPNSSICSLPRNNPAFDPNVCDAILFQEDDPDSTTGLIDLSLGVNGSWEATRFDVVYLPTIYVYNDPGLNKFAHALQAIWNRRASPKSTFNLSDEFQYTPEQVIDPNTLGRGSLLTTRTRTLSNNFTATYDFRATERFGVLLKYGNQQRSYAADRFVDVSGNEAGLHLRTDIASRTTLRFAYEHAIFAFGDGRNRDPMDPNAPPAPSLATPLDTTRDLAYVGMTFDLIHPGEAAPDRPDEKVPERPGRTQVRHKSGVAFEIDAGLNRLTPDGPTDDDYTRPYLNGSLSWHRGWSSVALGYTRALDDGGGAFANADGRVSWVDLRMGFTSRWSLQLGGNASVHERIEFSPAGRFPNDKIRTLTARTALLFNMTEHWSLEGSYSWYKQDVPDATCFEEGEAGVPELTNSRYLFGFRWESY